MDYKAPGGVRTACSRIGLKILWFGGVLSATYVTLELKAD